MEAYRERYRREGKEIQTLIIYTTTYVTNFAVLY